MKTKMRKQSLPKRKKILSELVPNRPPVGDRWELLDFENEYKDNWLWVALCVVEGYGKVWLKLFIWRWAPDKVGKTLKTISLVLQQYQIFSC